MPIADIAGALCSISCVVRASAPAEGQGRARAVGLSGTRVRFVARCWSSHREAKVRLGLDQQAPRRPGTAP
jgi:hypothetical protein